MVAAGSSAWRDDAAQPVSSAESEAMAKSFENVMVAPSSSGPATQRREPARLTGLICAHDRSNPAQEVEQPRDVALASPCSGGDDRRISVVKSRTTSDSGAHGPFRRRVQPADTEEDVSLGIELDGKYHIESVLAAGAMGTLFAATDVTLGRRTAIKVARVLPEHQRELDRRLILEAQCAARLRCEHVARVLEIGQLPSGAPFVVMDLLDGEDLESVLGRLRRLPVRTAVGYVVQACVGLAEAHGLGIVHRDIKPENLFLAKMLDGSEVIKVIDFGASTFVRSLPDGSASPRDRMVVGTPLYMAPERIRDTSSSDPRSDIWSLGALLYELCTGVMPFDADTVRDVCERVLHDAPEPPSRHRRELPSGLERAILRCLDKDPHARFTDVAALAVALSRFGPEDAWQLAVRARRMLAGAAAQSDGARTSQPPSSMPPRPSSRPSPASTPASRPSVPPRPTPRSGRPNKAPPPRTPQKSEPLLLRRREDGKASSE
jgi:serine/threonine-protein kinase